jgi:hypothetical protein
MTKTLEQVIASNSWRKLISGEPYGESKQVELTVKAELTKLGGNSYAHYSITGTVKKLDKRYRDPVITCGAIHDTILKHFPELAPIVKVHLSEPDGLPMHAEANARYWCGFSKYADGRVMSPRDSYGRITIETDADGIEWSPDTLASHLQTDRATACELREGLKSGLPWDKVTAQLGLIELWSKQAGAARKLLNDKAVA